MGIKVIVRLGTRICLCDGHLWLYVYNSRVM